MSELALQLIAENQAKHARGEDATFLDLGRCGLERLPPELAGVPLPRASILGLPKTCP